MKPADRNEGDERARMHRDLKEGRGIWEGCVEVGPEEIARAMREEEEGEIAHYRELYGPGWTPGPEEDTTG